MRFAAFSAVFAALSFSPAALCDGPPAAPNLDKLQAQFAATTKDLVKNMRVVSSSAPQCSFFGNSIASALQDPIQAIPPGAAKIEASLNKFKANVTTIGAAPSEGVDISDGAALAVKAKQKQILAAVAGPEAAIDSVTPVVNEGVQKMQQNYAKAMGMMRGDSPACQSGSAAFQAVYTDSVAADKQLKAIRAALEGQKVALLRWTSGVQASLGANN